MTAVAEGGGGGGVDYTFKFIIIGESNAGKSSLLQFFINGRMNEISKHTVGVEFGSRTIALGAGGGADGHGAEGGPTASDGTAVVKLQIWDTAGQDRFRSMTRSYYRGAVGCMVVFSLTDRASFDRLPQWFSDARSQASAGVCTILVGNKSDLPDAERQVTLLEASKLAQAEGCCAYVETSARTGDHVEFAFFKLARAVLAQIECGAVDATLLTSPTGGGKGGSSTSGGGGGGWGRGGAAGAGGEGGGGCSC